MQLAVHQLFRSVSLLNCWCSWNSQKNQVKVISLLILPYMAFYTWRNTALGYFLFTMNYRNTNELSTSNINLHLESIIWNKNVTLSYMVKIIIKTLSSSTGNNYAVWSLLQSSSRNLGWICLLINKLLQLNLHSVRVPKGLHFLLERATSVTMEYMIHPFQDRIQFFPFSC